MKKLSPAIQRILNTVDRLTDDRGYIPSCDEIREVVMGGVSHKNLSNGLKIYKALRLDGQQQAQQYLQMAGVMILALNEKGEVSMINKKGCDILGYDEQDILGKNWFEHFLPETTRLYFRHIFSQLVSGTIEHNQFIGDGKVLCSDNTERWISWHNNVLRDSSGHYSGVLISGEDTTERKEIEQKLIIAEKQAEKDRIFLHNIINSVADPIMVIGLDYKIQMMNRAARKNVDKNEDDPSCLYCYQVSHGASAPCHKNDEECPLELVKTTMQPVSVTHEHQSCEHSGRVYELIASPLFDENNELIGIIESSRDITDRVSFEEQLQHSNKNVHYLTYRDQLTHLPNQLLLADRLSQFINNASEKQRNIVVFHLDLDRFKQLNETFGRNVADEILIAVAKRLSNSLDKSETLARLGADEFAIVSTNISDVENAAVMAHQILQAFKEPFYINNQLYQLTASMGISLFPQDGDNSEQLLHKADTALHKAKDRRRNSFQFYQESMTEQTLAYVMLESNLRKSLIKKQLVLHYQPKIDLSDGHICGLEALVRWQHEEMGLVMPARFIPVAEESELIVEIGAWVIKTACMQALSWHRQGLVFGRIAVNLSTKQLLDNQLVRQIQCILDETGCPAHLLELEVTESYLMDNVKNAVLMLEEIRAMGIALSIDDFGTGYSSMSQLKRLPIDTLKIDQGFVKDLIQNTQDNAISQAIITLGKAMGLTIVAEGIETQEQADFLKSSGCHQGQGFLFYKPLEAEKVKSLLSLSRQYF